MLGESLGSISSAIHAGPGRVAMGIEVKSLDHGLIDFPSLREGRVAVEPYDFILVDEAQFFAPIWFEIIKLILTAGADINHRSNDGGTALHSWSTETDGVEVTVRCTRYAEIAFGWLFLGGQPLERTAVAGARAPTTP